MGEGLCGVNVCLVNEANAVEFTIPMDCGPGAVYPLLNQPGTHQIIVSKESYQTWEIEPVQQFA
jgi:hypothetical protein